ncbi:hydrocephalus-inducing protein homolog [Phaenicophaeus curvirostris]|uniref:hydrocephalus-inducing protein homolog n=1 Tax=Phaenicophaeus curvirostris TaxID=33595 RepID=UPI0037F0D73E
MTEFSAADRQKSFFQPFPAELVFQNFVAPEVYEKAVVLRNNDKVPRLVKVTTEISPYFKLVNHDLAWHKVPPGRTATFHILFIPEENKDYLHELICITERGEFIVPIRAIGARAVLDFPAHLDFSVCPVNYSTRKTLLICNVGSREARYRISPRRLCRGFQKQREKVQGDSLLFSNDVFTIDPVEGDVLPDSSVEINVIFKPQEARVYEQTVYCDISGREARLPLHIKAEGIGPQLWFSYKQLDIGDVSVGSARSCEVFLFNEGDIDGAFSLIPPSTALGSCFTFRPQKGIVSPHGFQVIKISFSSTTLGKFTEEFRFRVNGSAEPLNLTIGVALKAEYKDAAAVQYSSLVPCGIIQPHSWVQIPFTLQTRVMGEQDTVARVMTIGREGSPLEIHLVNFGEGPVVCVHPSKIDFGSIQVLQDVSQTLHLSNQSRTPASFWAEMAGKCSCWRIEPSKGVIPPNAELSVAVTANLDDTEIFNDEVKVFIENSCSYVIPVQAVGTGITIGTDKPIVPELDLGPHFSKIPFCYRFKQHHCLDALSTTEGEDSSQNPKSACPMLKLRPLSMELMPGKSMEMVVEGFSSTPQAIRIRYASSQVVSTCRVFSGCPGHTCWVTCSSRTRVVKERLLWHAVVGSKEEKVQVMQVDVTCEFIAPVLQLSSTELIFRVEKPVKLEAGEERHLSIRFNPAYEEGLTSREVEKVLKIHVLEHPHKEQVTVRGEVYFPNLHIQTTALDFGCLLNDTEAVRSIEITNCSPIPVQHRWFLTESPASQMRPVVSMAALNMDALGTVTAFQSDAGMRVCPPRPRRPDTVGFSAQVDKRVTRNVEEKLLQDLTSKLHVFTALPLAGALSPGQRCNVQVGFSPTEEVIDHSISEGDKITSVIPIQESAKPAFSEYRISPASFINFGSMLRGTKKTCTFTLENKGVQAFKFQICRVPPKPSAHQLKPAHPCKSKDTRTVFGKRSKPLLKQDAGPVMESLKDPSYRLHPLHPKSFLYATQNRPGAPPGLFFLF